MIIDLIMAANRNAIVHKFPDNLIVETISRKYETIFFHLWLTNSALLFNRLVLKKKTWKLHFRKLQ